MLRMKGLVDATPNIEYTPTAVLQKLLAPNHDQSAGSVESIADNWLSKMENLLEIMECPERFKVHLATYEFEKEVEGGQ